jgi:hypothetical protein
MKQMADAHRRDDKFTVGDWFKLQPYHQNIVFRRGHQKLANKFFGPWAWMNRGEQPGSSKHRNKQLLGPSCTT